MEASNDRPCAIECGRVRTTTGGNTATALQLHYRTKSNGGAPEPSTLFWGVLIIGCYCN